MEPLQKIKNVIESRFGRQIDDQEAKNILDNLQKNTEGLQSSIGGFSNSRYALAYENLEKLEIYFSPNAITEHVHRLIQEVGVDAFEKSGKYKSTRELAVASRFVVGLKKVYNEEWMIKGQDAPDIILAKKSGRTWTDRPFDAIHLEIMEITPETKKSWDQKQIELECANFIAEKKLNKDFGKYAHLLVMIRFAHNSLDLNKIKAHLEKVKGWRLHQIWVMMLTDATGDKFAISRVYPEYYGTEIDLNKEGKNLIF